ncbi:MAG: hypothetical protein LBQ89_03045 [Treponema sp.]|jgi:hypothetical protein|nr:hypothetical protein [Treponema sp.]
MNKAQAIAFIAILYAQEIEDRAETIKNAAKENNVKEGELFKLLKEAGFEPRAPKGTAAPNGADIQQQSNNTPPNSEKDAKKIPVLVSHKTEYEKYRCAGLVLTQKPENYLVTGTQFEKLKHDPWVVVGK